MMSFFVDHEHKRRGGRPAALFEIYRSFCDLLRGGTNEEQPRNRIRSVRRDTTHLAGPVDQA